MKNLKLLALLCAMAIFVVSCGEKEGEESNPVKTCCAKPIDGKVATKFIGANGEEVDIQTNYWLIDDGEVQFQMNMGGINGNLQDLLRSEVLLKEVLGSENIYSITLYLDKYLNSDTSINISNIKGISTFEVVGKKLIHKLYIEKEARFEFVENTKVVVPDVTTNHESYYFKNYVFKQNYDKKAYLSFGGKNYLNLKDKFNSNVPMVFETNDEGKSEIKHGPFFNAISIIDGKIRKGLEKCGIINAD